MATRELVWRLRVWSIRASTLSGGGECRTFFYMECLKHIGHKGDPKVTLRTCGIGGERAQVILV